MFGRRFNLALLTVILTIGVALELVAKTNPVWLVARLFAGWGTGMVQTGVPVYISEIAYVLTFRIVSTNVRSPHMLRGGLIATYNFWFGVGQFAGAIALQVAVNQMGYKGPIYAQFVFIGVMVISFPFIPETPCE
jgi:MFS family permease